MTTHSLDESKLNQNTFDAIHSKMKGSSAEEIAFFYKNIKSALHQLCGSEEIPLDDLIETLEWQELASGDCLYAQNSAGDCMHVLVFGRLRVVHEQNGESTPVGEIASGECVGEMALLSEGIRTASVFAARNSLLVKLTKKQFEAFCTIHPQLLLGISKTLIQRLTERKTAKQKGTKFKNIALLPLGKGLDLDEVAELLRQNLKPHGKVLLLNKKNINAFLGEKNFVDFGDSSLDKIKLGRTLETLEQSYDYVLYQGLEENSAWTQICTQQADKVILLKDFYQKEQSAEEKVLIENVQKLSYVSKTLVLLHPNGEKTPSNTKYHLKLYNAKEHHHIRMDNPTDFGRLARLIIGKAIGLVLGGGGAKGFAHIGIYKRMLELNIPIDYVGGTSIGAIMASGVAMDLDFDTYYSLARSGFIDDKVLKDRTIPLVSYYGGSRLDNSLKKNYDGLNIEDLWVNFFCVSANLSKAGMCVHTEGAVWKWVRASVSIPGAFPPVVSGNDLLVDGGLMNNLPIDIMSNFGIKKIYAVNLSAEKEYELSYDKIPSAVQLLKNKLTSKKKKFKVPNLMTIISKSILLASYQRLGEVRHMAHIIMDPPVHRIGLLDFKRFEEGIEIGYEYATEVLKEE